MDNRNLRIALLIIAISISQVSALGVSSPYWKDNPLQMYPGQTTEIEFVLLQSTEEKESSSVIVSIIEGKDITKLISGEKYVVEPGSIDDKIILEISIPKNAKVGETYNIGLSVKPDSKSETGNIQIDIKYNIDFPILVTEKSEALQSNNKKSANFNILIIILAIVILCLIIVLLVIKRKK